MIQVEPTIFNSLKNLFYIVRIALYLFYRPFTVIYFIFKW